MFWIVCDPSSGSMELCLTEITRSGSQIFVVCLVGVFVSVIFEPVVCVCVRACVRARARSDGQQFPARRTVHTTSNFSQAQLRSP